MILYADTSALVKRYVREAGSEQVVSYFDRFPLIATAAITQAEMASAMAKAARLGWVDEPDVRTAWQDFSSHWLAYVRLPLSAAAIERAASLAWRRGLRAYDAVHLASALAWRDAAGEDLVFACFDQHLSHAAREEGLQAWPG